MCTPNLRVGINFLALSVILCFGQLGQLSDWAMPQASSAAHAQEIKKTPPADSREDFVNQRLRSMLNVELQRIERVCKPMEKQSLAIRDEAESILKDVRDASDKFTIRVMQAIERGEQKDIVPLDSQKLIRDRLAASVKHRLSVAQVERYENEIARLGALRTVTATRNWIVLLDESIVLTEDQRQQLSKRLPAEGDDEWFQSLEILRNQHGFLPDLSDQAVASVLNESQSKIWAQGPRRRKAPSGEAAMPFMKNLVGAKAPVELPSRVFDSLFFRQSAAAGIMMW